MPLNLVVIGGPGAANALIVGDRGTANADRGGGVRVTKRIHMYPLGMHSCPAHWQRFFFGFVVVAVVVL